MKVYVWHGGHKVGEKNFLSFPGFSRAINLLFRRLSQQKVNVIMTFINGHLTSTPAIQTSCGVRHNQHAPCCHLANDTDLLTPVL